MTFDEIIMNHALPALAMGAMTMVLVGVVKIFTKMIKADDSKVKAVMSKLYTVMSAAIAFGLACGYYQFIIHSFEWIATIKLAAEVFAVTQVLYPIYRDYGGRYLLLKFLSLFKNKNDKVDKIIETIEGVLILTDGQKAAIENALTKTDAKK